MKSHIGRNPLQDLSTSIKTEDGEFVKVFYSFQFPWWRRFWLWLKRKEYNPQVDIELNGTTHEEVGTKDDPYIAYDFFGTGMEIITTPEDNISGAKIFGATHKTTIQHIKYQPHTRIAVCEGIHMVKLIARESFRFVKGNLTVQRIKITAQTKDNFISDLPLGYA